MEREFQNIEKKKWRHIILKAHSYLFPQTSSFSDCSLYFNEAPDSCSHAYEIFSKHFPITVILAVSLPGLKDPSRHWNQTTVTSSSPQSKDGKWSSSEIPSPTEWLWPPALLCWKYLSPHQGTAAKRDMTHVMSALNTGAGSERKIVMYYCPSWPLPSMSLLQLVMNPTLPWVYSCVRSFHLSPNFFEEFREREFFSPFY